MVRIDIISGFLGAGKTTFIKRLLETKLKNEKVVLIENEYGAVSIDSDMLQGSGIEIKELSQGCICCSLVGDFSKSLKEVIEKFNPDIILIEPSGVGKLSDVINAVSDAGLAEDINSLVCMVDAKKAKMYDKNFGEFFVDQIKNAQTVILSRMDISKEETAISALEIIRKHNQSCVVITTPINELSDEDLIKAYEGFDITLIDNDHECECGHHHHHDEECECGHHHHHDEECECGHHHHHDEKCECGHHHHHDEKCECGHHHHHDEECECGHHHHAEDVFTSIGIETVKKYDIDNLKHLLHHMAHGDYGQIIRAKGIVCSKDGKWYMFNLTPDEVEVLENKAVPMGKIVVIGTGINESEIKKLF